VSSRRTSRRIRCIDLFCGAGGSSWGAQKAGVEIVAAFDMWSAAATVYRDNFPQTTFYEGKLENRRVKSIAKQLGKIDLILASPECTNHSPAKGNKPRCEESKKTAFQVVRFARVLKPRWIVIENVVSMRKWSRYSDFIQKLENLGYHIHEQVLNAVDFSVPQSRRRLFIMCDRKRQPVVIAPSRRGPAKTARSFVNMNGTYDLSPLKAKGRARPTLARARRAIKELGEATPFLMVYYGSDAAGGWQRLGVPLRTITTLDRFALVKPRKSGHVMRMRQVPERKVAMGMKGMQFNKGSRRNRIKMIGNAVCPPVMCKVVGSLTRSK
jgi:DNA (cytosine-5)-methyltransferase 1